MQTICKGIIKHSCLTDMVATLSDTPKSAQNLAIATAGIAISQLLHITNSYLL